MCGTSIHRAILVNYGDDVVLHGHDTRYLSNFEALTFLDPPSTGSF